HRCRFWFSTSHLFFEFPLRRLASSGRGVWGWFAILTVKERCRFDALRAKGAEDFTAPRGQPRFLFLALWSKNDDSCRWLLYPALSLINCNAIAVQCSLLCFLR